MPADERIQSAQRKSRLQFRQAQLSDAADLGPILRKADRLEIQAVVGRDAIETLRDGIASSDPCWTVTDESDVPMALFGVVPDREIPRSGMIWLLGSDRLVDHQVEVLRLSRQWIARLHERYDHFWNYIDARNDVHVKWVRWCGFRLVQLVEDHGFEQRPFWKIERSRPGSEFV